MSDIPHALTFGEEPLPRQGLFLGPFLLSVVLVSLGDVGDLGPLYSVGLAVVVVATIVAVWLHVRPDPRLLWLVPVLDLVGLSLMRLVPLSTASGVAVLAFLPALWLAADYILRGVVAVAALGVVCMTVPTLLYYGTDPSVLSRAVMTPLALVLCALAIALAKRLWLQQQAQLEDQGKLLEEALRESQEHRAINDAIVSAVDVGLVLLDRDGGYRSTNPRQREFMDLAYPEGHAGVAGQLGFVYGPDRRTPLRRDDMPTVRAMADRTLSDYLIWIGEDEDDQRALRVSAQPVHDQSGEFTGSVLVYKDVTDLVSALKVRDDFVASVSHELRTPLTSIMGFLDLLLDRGGLDPSTTAQLEIVRRNADRLHHLVSDLLTIAKTDEGGISLRAVSTDLSVLVGQALGDMAPVAAAAAVRVESRVGPGIELVVDPVRIRQMIDNLLSNAVKYTPAGGLVTVSLVEDADQVVLRVADTGIGIAQADLDRLFTKFFRAQDVETRAIQGIGLGLAITKSIVEAHDGVIAVESRTEEGTDFEVRLPRQHHQVGVLEPTGPSGGF